MQPRTPLEREKDGTIKKMANSEHTCKIRTLSHNVAADVACQVSPSHAHPHHAYVTCSVKLNGKPLGVPCHAIKQACKNSGSVSFTLIKTTIPDTWLATPTGQLFVWQMRAITQPVAIIATEPNPYSSAPIVAAIRTSTPLLKPPSTLRMTRSLSPFSMSVCKKFEYQIIKP